MTFGKFMNKSIILKYPLHRNQSFFNLDAFLYLHTRRGQTGGPMVRRRSGIKGIYVSSFELCLTYLMKFPRI